MKLSLTHFFPMLMVLVILSSCSSMERLSVKWKYRNDYWVKKSDPKSSSSEKVSEQQLSNQELSSSSEPLNQPLPEELSGSAQKISPQVQSQLSLAETQKKEKVSFPKSILEKKLGKLQKKMHSTNDNGSTWGLLSFIFGLLGLVGLFLFGPLVGLSILGLIFGIIGLSGDKDGKGLALIGLILSIITIFILIFGLALFSASFF